MASKNTRSEKEKSDLMAALTQLLNEKLDPINNKLQKLDLIENSVGYAVEELKKLTDLEITVEQFSLDFKQIEQELNAVKNENKMLKDRLIRQELYSRRNNLRIWGVLVDKSDGVESKLLNLFQSCGIDIHSTDIERAHFVGPLVRNKPRAILVKFISSKFKMAVVHKRDTFKAKNITFADDYPDEILEHRRLILPTYFKALETCPQMNPKLRIDSLILAGKEYTSDNIDTIPVKELQPDRIFTPTHNGVTSFFSKFSPLSNHYPANIQADGHTFYSSEQYFMYLKAKHFKDAGSVDKIRHAKSPAEAKGLGKKVENFDKKSWNAVAEDMMYKAMYEKFNQNNSLKDFLMKTRGTDLAEANPSDLYWGTGISLRSRDTFNPNKWVGKNMAGKVLSRVRDSLI